MFHFREKGWQKNKKYEIIKYINEYEKAANFKYTFLLIKILQTVFAVCRLNIVQKFIWYVNKCFYEF